MKNRRRKFLKMAEWSELPNDVLLKIAESLNAAFDIFRFRSVCSTWRNSVNPKPRRLRFPIIPNDGIFKTSWGFHLSKRIVYSISIPGKNSGSESPTSSTSSSSVSCDWIVKVEEDVPNRMHLLHPLSGKRFKPLPAFVRNLDMLKFRVLELGQEYVMHYIDYRPLANSLCEESTLYSEKVVFCQNGDLDNNGSSNGSGYKLLAIRAEGMLAMFESGDKKWKLIEDMDLLYDDVILYKGEFYAVGYCGRTMMVESASKIELAAESVFGGYQKYLVESCGCLLLVDMYLKMGQEHRLSSLGERIDRLKVYKLMGKEKKWAEVENLGDRILFLGKNCVFSVSTADLAGYEGNCIYIMNCMNGRDDGTGELHATDLVIYHMNSNKVECLTSDSEDWKLFWPPPSWISITMGFEKRTCRSSDRIGDRILI